MGNIYDYITNYKDYTFEEILFNDLDALIFSQLTYINFNKELVENSKNLIALNCLLDYVGDHERGIFFNTDNKLMRDSVKLLENLKYSKRFTPVKAFNFAKKVNEETQFSAISFLLPNKTIFIAFEGTDTSIIGWKEDFELIYKYPVNVQISAIEYVNKTINLFTSKVIIGGHSKGGNLAISSAMGCKNYLKKKIIAIYSFDGPGFLEEQINSKEYLSIERKIKAIVPKESFVGMLLYHPKELLIIKSNHHGLLQHDVFNWQCFGGVFIKDTLSKKSEKNNKTITSFINELSLIERKNFVDTVFSVFKKAEITDTKEIKLTKLNKCLALIKEITVLDKKTKETLIKFIKMLISDL